MNDIQDIWVFLSATPLFWLMTTLLAYALAQKLYQLAHWNSFLNPVAVAIALLVCLLAVSKTPYESYFNGAQFIHFLLGPTTVALAIPLFDLRAQLAKTWLPVLLGLAAGSVTAIVSAILIAGWFGASPVTMISLAPKSVTTPIAMSITEKLGGLPALSASFVVITGVLGAVLAGPVYKLLRIEGDAARGFSLGLCSHGIGTSRAFQFSSEAGAYASLAIGLTGLTCAITAPFITPFLVSFFTN
jgi:predicted murein hydrolase (TIGR00659 family)